MKILYAIQGTGNGHVSRARDIIPFLRQYGELDILLSGTQADVMLGFPVRYRFHGLSFIFGKRGGIDFWKTIRSIRFLNLLHEIWHLKVREYDIIINDFEPVSAWACLLKSKRCIGLSHQAAVIHPFAPKPDKVNWLGYLILRYYAPVKNAYGFHFRMYAEKISSPIIREEVRLLAGVKGESFYTVYLPAYSDERIIRVLSVLDADFRVFSKHCVERKKIKNVEILPVNNSLYLQSLSTCKGVICGAGFEGPAEALFLRKKLLVIPMKGQYEQQCNAAALRALGVTVLTSFDTKSIPALEGFMAHSTVPVVDFPDETKEIISKLMHENTVTDYSLAFSSFS